MLPPFGFATYALGLIITCTVHAVMIGGLALLCQRLVEDPRLRRNLLRFALIAPLVTGPLSLAWPRSYPAASHPAPEVLPGDAGLFEVLGTDASSQPPTSNASFPAGDAGHIPRSLPSRVPRWAVVAALLVWLTGGISLHLREARRRSTLLRQLEGRRVIHTGPTRLRLDAMLATSGYRRQVLLTINSRLPVPVALGASEISLPAYHTLGPGAVTDGILAHELAHLESRDTLWQHAATNLTSWLWLNPARPLLLRALADAAEEAADRRAIELTGDRLDLARSLYHYATGAVTAPRPLTAYSGRPGHLLRRIHRILGPDRNLTSGWRRLSFTMAATLSAGAGVITPPLRIASPPDTPERAPMPPAVAMPMKAVPGTVAAALDSPVVRRGGQSLSVGHASAVPDTDDVAGRRQLAISIGLGEPVGGIAELRPLLDDSAATVRLAAVWALGEYDRAELEAAGVAGEFARFTRDPVVEIRRQAAAIIGIHELRADADAVAALLGDDSSVVRATAVWALGEMESPDLLRPATALAGDPSPTVRRALASAMYRTSHPNWRPVLNSLAADENPDVGAMARAALARIRD